MKGVQILNTIYEYGNLMHPMWSVSFTVATLTIAILGLCTIKYDVIQTILKRCVVFTIIGMIICLFGLMIETKEIVDIKYKVTISEDVNFGEFMERYEILDQEGKIYTIREKN